MSVTILERPATLRPLLIAVVVVVVGIGLYLSVGWRTVHIVRATISQPLGAATSADVTIAMAIGRLQLGALDQPGDLIAGQIAYPEVNRVDRAFAVSGDTASFTLREQDSQRNSLVKYRDDDAIWDLSVATGTPMRLRIEAGIGESVLDLARLNLTERELQTGIGTTTLTLPQSGQAQARVIGGVGNTTIRVPAGVALRLTTDAGIGGVDVRGNYQRQGNRYVSPGYDTAANRVELAVSSGVGTITIDQISE
jgi:hypothetical protein